MILKSKSIVFTTVFILFAVAFTSNHCLAQTTTENKKLHQLFDDYYEERLKFFPLEATQQGDMRYNDLLPNTGTASYLKAQHDFYSKYLHQLKTYNYNSLNAEDKISYDILNDFITRSLGTEQYHPEYMPISQVFSLPLTMGQLGSGTGNQPFKTVKDYDDWLKRVSAFTPWADTAIENFRAGVRSGVVLPKALVVKIIPQMQSLAQSDVTKSVFYGPINNLPKSFSDADKTRLTEAYKTAILNQLIPSYKKLGDFFSNEYLAQARTTSGISALPNGAAMYNFLVYYHTTTHKSAEEMYNTGLSEVDRITGEMEKIKASIGFKGTLKELFEFMKTDKQFMSFKTSQEVLDAYQAVLNKIQPHLDTYFGIHPKTAFEVREVEKFRAASAPPQYNSGSPDGTRPGIFYVPIPDPTKINVTGWAMESVFLHEAIPGHHFQISLQQENENLPKFRRHTFAGAFTEGWGLYSESLGEKIGCYTDPYQKLGSLGTEIHRAIRLVVDAGIHTGKMNREEAIQYMLAHEALPEQTATLEIERYMAMPGQALSYKTGELKIKELLDKYQQQLGVKFNLKNFHDALLQGGSMPLDVFERYMDEWARVQK